MLEEHGSKRKRKHHENRLSQASESLLIRYEKGNGQVTSRREKCF